MTLTREAEAVVPAAIGRPGLGKAAWGVLGVGFAARMLAILFTAISTPRDWLFSRGIEMGLLANSLLHGLGYSSPFGVPTGPTAFIAPGYPTLIAGIFLIFGSNSFASAIAIMTLQALVNLLTIWLMMRICAEALDPRAATLAGVIWAVSPPLIFMPTIFWETSLSACALVGMILLALRVGRTPTRRMWALQGALSGAVALINPALLPLSILLMGWAAWRARRRSAGGAGIALLALTVVFSPWPVRNAIRFHTLILTRTTVGFELWMGNRPGATGYLNESLFPMYNKAELASYVAQGELAYTQGKSEQAKEYILGRPGIFIALSARRFVRFWTGTGNSAGSPLYAIHSVLTTGLGWMGVGILFLRRRRGIATLLALPLLAFPLPYYLTHAEFRYRLVIDPLLTLLAAYAVTQFAGRGDADAEGLAMDGDEVEENYVSGFQPSVMRGIRT